MKLQHHFLISFLTGISYLSLINQPINLINLFPWFTGGVLIDLDHFITCGKRSKTLNFKRLSKIVIDDYKTNNHRFYLFHTVEFTLFLSFMVAKTALTWPYLLSYSIHLFCDGFRQKKIDQSYSWLKKWSLAYYARTTRSRNN